jgi:hypothetical protein
MMREGPNREYYLKRLIAVEGVAVGAVGASVPG